MSAQGMPRVPPPAAAAPPRRPPPVVARVPQAFPLPSRRGPSKTVMVLGVIAVVSVTAAAASIAWRLSAPDTIIAPTLPASMERSVAPPASAAEPAPVPRASGSSVPGPAPRPPPPVPEDTAACFATMLPDDAYGRREPNLDRLCTGTKAYGTMLKLKTEIVRAGGQSRVTPAMQEWSHLGWFETAAFAAMRAHCCPDAPALDAGDKHARCKMEASLAYIGNAIDDDEKMKKATEAYRESARCIAMAGGGYLWGRFDAPYGGEEHFFFKIHERMKKARGR